MFERNQGMQFVGSGCGAGRGGTTERAATRRDSYQFGRKACKATSGASSETSELQRPPAALDNQTFRMHTTKSQDLLDVWMFAYGIFGIWMFGIVYV